MDEKLTEILNSLMKYGSLSPSTINKIGEDFGFQKKTIQFTVQIALDKGIWKLDRDLKIASNPLYTGK